MNLIQKRDNQLLAHGPGDYIIRIEWGSWSRYDPRAGQREDHWWDGYSHADGGHIAEASLILYEGKWGAQCEKYQRLRGPYWRWRRKNNTELLGGVVLRISGDADTLVFFCSKATEVGFRIGDIEEQGSKRSHVGQKYSGVDVTVTLDGIDVNLDHQSDFDMLTKKDGRWRLLLACGAFDGPVRRWFRVDWVWIAPGSVVSAEIPEPDWKKLSGGQNQTIEATVHAVAAVPSLQEAPISSIEEGETETTWIPYQIYLNEKPVSNGSQHFGCTSWLRGNIPYKEEICASLESGSFRPGTNVLKVKNDSKRSYLLVSRVVLEQTIQTDFEIAMCPKWLLCGQEFEIDVTCRRIQKNIRLELPFGISLLNELPSVLEVGEYQFRMRADEPLADADIVFKSENRSCSARIEQISTAKHEPFPMRVGVEDNCFPATDPDLEERILRELKNRQLGDFIDIRREDLPNVDQLLGWVRSACKKGIYQQISMSVGGHWRTRDDIGVQWGAAAWRESGDYGTGFQWDEHDGPLWNYNVNPRKLKASVSTRERTMRTACEDYRAYLGRLVSQCREEQPDMPVWLRISTLGHGNAYAAGMDGCLAQLNKSHNVLLLADAKGASREHRVSIWASYIAEGAHLNPESEDHLRMWWLALHLSYICGASIANDEECLFRSWHGYQYSWTDRFPRMRQEILQRFNRYVKTHPRRGKLIARQALLTGRFSCDVVDGFCSSDEPKVWCNFGAGTPEWNPLTPEYGLKYLDVFFPGVWLQSLDQRPERVRRLYSGTPHGELEIVSIDAPVLQEYALLLLLGWNTMNLQSYEHLKRYVENGGRLFLSVPHLTTNESRSFLVNDLEPLNLLNNGNFSDFLGVEVTGRGPRITGIRVEGESLPEPFAGKEYNQVHGNYLPSAKPPHGKVDIAEVRLTGAEVIARDEPSNFPVIVRNQIGKGEVYLLTTWDYPGNSWLSNMMWDFIESLARTNSGLVSIEDPSGDIYFTMRDEGEGGANRIHLLNTDWTRAGNAIPCILHYGVDSLQLTIREGVCTQVTIFRQLAVLIDDEITHLEEISVDEEMHSLVLHGYGKVTLSVKALGGADCGNITFNENACKVEMGTEWQSVGIDFGESTIGTMKIRVQIN